MDLKENLLQENLVGTCGFVVPVLTPYNVPQDKITQVTSIIMAGATLIATYWLKALRTQCQTMEQTSSLKMTLKTMCQKKTGLNNGLHASQIIKLAKSQRGYHERPAGSNKTKYGKEYGMNGTPWCAILFGGASSTLVQANCSLAERKLLCSDTCRLLHQTQTYS